MVGTLRIGFELRIEKVGEEEQFEHAEHDQQLDREQLPQGAPQAHRAEAVVVEKADFFQHGESLPFHDKSRQSDCIPDQEIFQYSTRQFKYNQNGNNYTRHQQAVKQLMIF
jgi:predicted RNA-binding protein (virulence factor B family)